ncbi:MAG: hypothetical protein KDK36_07080, partial [Leptospiraceae bacterium]|nr:hypothetical protein [Leptospiraceae bacterium]
KYRNSLNIMGWDVEEDGLQVIFDRSIPSLIQKNFSIVFKDFLNESELNQNQISHYLFHPGGKKVLDAFEESINITPEQLKFSHLILKKFGNLSSPTVYFVIEEFLKTFNITEIENGVMTAMGPGFSTELLLFETTGD